ncbi:MAG: IS3 family transposase [Calditrichia bacterium]
MKYEFIHTHRRAFTVKRLCRNLCVSPSGYYNWLKRPISNRQRANQALRTHVRATFKEYRNRYGSPRIYRELRALGIECSLTG